MSEQTTSAAAKKGFITAASNAENTIMTSIIGQLEKRGIKLDEYQKECGINAVSAINALLYAAGLTWASPELDPSNYQDIIKKVAVQKLNAIASNREVYFQFRNTKIGGTWKKLIEVGIEGDGNDAILRNFGVDVKKVHPFWEVREGDKFEYPSFNGISKTPPKWSPTGKGKTSRIVYPIELLDGNIDYRISEREDVKRNLIAHVNNSMMNETFNICKSRYDANADEKAKIDAKKREIKSKLDKQSLEEILDNAELEAWISPAWREGQSRESMIIRKMRNNAIKKFPKDFGSAYALQAYNELTDETIAAAAVEIETLANSGEVVDVDFKEEEKPPAPAQTPRIDSDTGEVLDESHSQKTELEGPDELAAFREELAAAEK